MDEVKNNDIIVDAKDILVNSLKTETPYPFQLKEDQIVRLIYFFGARKLSNKQSNQYAKKLIKVGEKLEGDERFTAIELFTLAEYYKWFRFSADTKAERKMAYKGVCVKFKVILDFLRKRPAYITLNIYNAMQVAGYMQVLKSVVVVVDREGKKTIRLVKANSDPRSVVPVGKMESMMWDIQNIALDKMMMILTSISPNDVRKATLGNKAKAMRDIYSFLHMARQANKNPNMTLMQINVNSAEPTDKLKGFSNYITKNRDSN